MAAALPPVAKGARGGYGVPVTAPGKSDDCERHRIYETGHQASFMIIIRECDHMCALTRHGAEVPSPTRGQPRQPRTRDSQYVLL